MIGKELAKLLRKTRGPVYIVMVHPHEAVAVQAVKTDLARWADEIGDQESHMALSVQDGRSYLDIDHGHVGNFE